MSGFEQVHYDEDNSRTLLARVTAAYATGTAISGEGYWVKQADVTSITRTVYDLTSDPAESVIVLGPTSISKTTAIKDTPVTDGILWDIQVNPLGYNFIDLVPKTAFPTGGHRYNVKYSFVMAGGEDFTMEYEGEARNVVGQ